MFDLFTVLRNNSLTRASARRLANATGRVTDAELEQIRDDYLADLTAEAEAAGLRVVVERAPTQERESVNG